MIRKRGNSFEIRVYAGLDADGKKQNFYATVQGTGRKAEREAKQKEGELLAEHQHVRREADARRDRAQVPEGRERVPVATTAHRRHVVGDHDVLAAGDLLVPETVGCLDEGDDVVELRRRPPTARGRRGSR